MASATEFVSLGDLYEEAGAEDDDVLDRLKALVSEYYPAGWRKWKVVNFSKTALFGKSIDPQTLNKIRFALPTLGVAKAFDPELVHIPEKSFRSFKVTMLEWSFCRALIISPPAIANKIRGSAAQAEIFIRALDPIKHLFVSRKHASDNLSQESSAVDSESELRSFSSRKRSNSEGFRPYPVKKSRVDVLERRMYDMFTTLSNKIDSLSKPQCADRGFEDGMNGSFLDTSDREASIYVGQPLEKRTWRTFCYRRCERRNHRYLQPYQR